MNRTTVPVQKEALSHLSVVLDELVKKVDAMSAKLDTLQDVRILDMDKRLVLQEERAAKLEKLINRAGAILATAIVGGILTLFIWLVQRGH